MVDIQTNEEYFKKFNEKMITIFKEQTKVPYGKNCKSCKYKDSIKTDIGILPFCGKDKIQTYKEDCPNYECGQTYMLDPWDVIELIHFLEGKELTEQELLLRQLVDDTNEILKK